MEYAVLERAIRIIVSSSWLYARHPKNHKLNYMIDEI